MSAALIAAHRIAHYIEVARCRDVARVSRMRKPWESFYDPLAATCLGDLIYTRMTGSK
jgi:hypothetical protein